MKKTSYLDPFERLLLDDEEMSIEAALEKNEYIEAPGSNDAKAILEIAATRYLELKTSKPVTIRINQLDLIRVKTRAKANNIPYQTLLGSLIHRYAEGHLEL